MGKGGNPNLKGCLPGADRSHSPLAGAVAGHPRHATETQLALTPLEREQHKAEAIALWLSGMKYTSICRELNARYDCAYYPKQIALWFRAYKLAQGEDRRGVVQAQRAEILEKRVAENLAEIDRRHLEGLRTAQEVSLEALTATGEGAPVFKDKRQAGDVYLGAVREERMIVAPRGREADDGQLVVQINMGSGQIQQAVMPMLEAPVTRKRTGRTARQRRKDDERPALPEAVEAAQ